MKSLLAKLRAFEAKYPPRHGKKCAACLLPEPLRKFIADSRKAGALNRHIAAVIASEGHRMTEAIVSYHLKHGQR